MDFRFSDYATQCLLSFRCVIGHSLWWYPQLWYVKNAASPVREPFLIVGLSLGRAIPGSNIIGCSTSKR